ncbi:hypothetical protein NFI96_011871, partial [Prochilodus magdalenae]
MWPHVSLISFCGVLTFVTKAAEIQSLRQIVSAELGTAVTLQCSFPEKVSLLYWYKQCFGMRPQLLVTVPKYGFVEFYDAGCSNHTILQMPMSYQGHLGDSVNFQCTVYTSVSNGGHNVYWFRHGSGESHPGIIYTHGNRSDQCKSSSETDSSTQSCVYKLPKRNLSLSDAGTYYCAVAACGQILFGNGSSLKVEGIAGIYLNGVVQLQDAVNSTFQTVKLGDSVTIRCYLPQKSVTTMVWYKQSIGKSPRPVALSYNYLSEAKFEDEFQNGRFHVSPKRGSFHLHITAVTQQDTGAYYCGIGFLNELQFVSWTFLMPTETEIKKLQKPILELVYPEGSATLECTVYTKNCSGGHSVYWFRHGSGESHPGIIYTHTNSNGQCKKMTKLGSSTQSCVYKLPKRNLSLSDAGTYYCAMLMCGEILYGTGAALKVMGNFGFFIIMLMVATKTVNWRTKHKAGNLQGKILQLDSVVTAKEGDNVTLSCLHPSDQINKVLWYQQPIGWKPLLVTSSYYHTLPFEFHNHFQETKRFNLLRAAGSTNLTITKVKAYDSAVYYCAGSFSNIVAFGAGTFLAFKGQHSNKYTILQPTVSQPLHPEDSETLQCTVLTKSCSGEHSVYWFRHGSGESHPGIIYTHGNRSDQCKSSSETDSSTQSCVYKLPKRNLSLSDAGTYHCAVAACGEILFGNGTKVDEPGGEGMLVMICLAVLLFISLTINVCLFLICRKKENPSRQVMTSDDTVSTVQYNLNKEMNYAALKFNTNSTKVK